MRKTTQIGQTTPIGLDGCRNGKAHGARVANGHDQTTAAAPIRGRIQNNQSRILDAILLIDLNFLQHVIGSAPQFDSRVHGQALGCQCHGNLVVARVVGI